MQEHGHLRAHRRVPARDPRRLALLPLSPQASVGLVRVEVDHVRGPEDGLGPEGVEGRDGLVGAGEAPQVFLHVVGVGVEAFGVPA